MPKRETQLTEPGKSFAERLARLRKAAGYSQRDFADEVGISYRMVAYYEKQSKLIPIHLLPLLAKVLGVSTDQLLGVEKVKDNGKHRDNRLWRRFSQIENLGTKEKRQILQYLDTFIEREQLKKKVGAQ